MVPLHTHQQLLINCWFPLKPTIKSRKRTKLEEGSHGVCLEPVLVRAPGVRVDYKEHSAVIGAESEESKVKLVAVSTCPELIRRSCILGDEHLVHVPAGVPVDVVVHQSVLL